MTVSLPIRASLQLTHREICRSPVSLTGPVVDYEPAPVDARHPEPARHTVYPPGHLVTPGSDVVAEHREIAPPHAALVFADTALRRVLEVTDRRRPCAQLRPLVSPALLDTVATLSRQPHADGAAVLRRVRLRTARQHDGLATAVEVFATFSRGPRLRAAAGRIEFACGRWQLVALQLG